MERADTRYRVDGPTVALDLTVVETAQENRAGEHQGESIG
jgi:hypothetical protein